ncbi:MAG: polysaccharide deacetylase family protein [Candidatus Binatia bacterium]
MARLLKLGVSIGFYAVWRLWRWRYRLLGRRPPATCLVLYYHAISAKERTSFARQMDILIRFARPIAADFPSTLEDGVHHVAVTFDDGFQSVVANALPELTQRKIPTTLFIPTGYLGQQPQWNRESSQPGCHETIITSQQLRTLISDVVSVGSHTVTHPALTTLGEEEAKRELQQSRQDLETLLERDVRLFSFPYGAYDHKLVALSRHAGYSRVFTTLPTLPDPEDYVVGRVCVQATDWPVEFYFKLLGAYRWLPFAFVCKRKMRSWFDHCVHYRGS